jgi:hypothetical protein
MKICKNFVALGLAVVLSFASASLTTAQSVGQTNETNPVKRIQWQSNLYGAYLQALQQGKPLVIYFYINGGNYCGKLEREVLSSDRVNALAGRAIYASADADKDDTFKNVAILKKSLDLKDYPAIVVFDVSRESLKERGRVIGFHELNSFYPSFANLLMKPASRVTATR